MTETTPNASADGLVERARKLVNPVVMVGDFDDDDDELEPTYPPPSGHAANEAVDMLASALAAATEALEAWMHIFKPTAEGGRDPEAPGWGQAIDDALAHGRAALARIAASNAECPGHQARDDNPKICRHCGTHVDSERLDENEL